MPSIYLPKDREATVDELEKAFSRKNSILPDFGSLFGPRKPPILPLNDQERDSIVSYKKCLATVQEKYERLKYLEDIEDEFNAIVHKDEKYSGHFSSQIEEIKNQISTASKTNALERASDPEIHRDRSNIKDIVEQRYLELKNNAFTEFSTELLNLKDLLSEPLQPIQDTRQASDTIANLIKKINTEADIKTVYPDIVKTLENILDGKIIDGSEINHIKSKAPNITIKLGINNKLWFKTSDKPFQPLYFDTDPKNEKKATIYKDNYLEMVQVHEITSSIMYQKGILKMDEPSNHVLITYDVDSEPIDLKNHAPNSLISGYDDGKTDDKTFILQIRLNAENFVTCVLRKENEMLEGECMGSSELGVNDTIRQSIHKVAQLIYGDDHILLQTPAGAVEEEKSHKYQLRIKDTTSVEDQKGNDCGFWASYNAIKGCDPEFLADVTKENIRQKMLDEVHLLGVRGERNLEFRNQEEAAVSDPFLVESSTPLSTAEAEEEAKEEEDLLGQTQGNRASGRNPPSPQPEKVTPLTIQRTLNTSATLSAHQSTSFQAATAVIDGDYDAVLDKLCGKEKLTHDFKTKLHKRFNINRECISYKEGSSDLKDNDIKDMVTYSAAQFRLDPITIKGGTHEQQIKAIKEALKQGFTHITVISPEDSVDPPLGYTKTVELAHHVRNNFTGYEACLKQLKESDDQKQLLDTLHRNVEGCCKDAHKSTYKKITSPGYRPGTLRGIVRPPKIDPIDPSPRSPS